MRVRVYLHFALWWALFAIFVWISAPIVGSAIKENGIGPVETNTSIDSYLRALTELGETFHRSSFWLLALVAIVYLVTSRKLGKLILAGAVVLPVIFYTLIYVFSTRPSYTAHMTSSVPRLLLHVKPRSALAIGLALSQLKPQPETL